MKNNKNREELQIEPTIEYPDGTKQWLLDGELHREGGPAIEYPGRADGAWYKNGKLHRVDGPALVLEDGTKHWYLDGELHRERGPAIEFASGSRHWLVAGKLHRIDGPAVEYANGNGAGEWYQNGKLHREDGPALDSDMKTKSGEYIKGWYLDGAVCTEEEHRSLVQKNKAKENIKSIKEGFRGDPNLSKNKIK